MTYKDLVNHNNQGGGIGLKAKVVLARPKKLVLPKT